MYFQKQPVSQIVLGGNKTKCFSEPLVLPNHMKLPAHGAVEDNNHDRKHVQREMWWN